MKRMPRIALVAVTGLALSALALHAQGTKPAVSEASSKAPAMTTPDQMKWMPNPGAPDVKMATAWGDPAKGAHGAFHKFPAGFTAPLHTHSSDLRAVVISGTMSVAGKDGKETMLPAGSYFFQPAGWQHVTKCQPGSDCVIYVTSTGKFDLHPVAAK